MILADTSIWIDFFRTETKVFVEFRSLLEKREVVSLDCIFGELLQGASHQRERKLILEYWDSIPKITITDLWVKAGSFSSESRMISKGVGLIDCAIILAARSVGASIWTKDKKMNGVLATTERYQP